MNWLQLYAEALQAADPAAGYYNRNVGLETPEGKVNVRIPLEAADIMDLRLWREEDVLAAIRPYVDRAPELRHVSSEPRFQVHTFIEGRVLDAFSPRDSAVPGHVITDVVTIIKQLAQIPQEKAPALPADWPASGDCPGFGHRLADETRGIHAAHMEEYGEVFSLFGIPSDPLAAVRPLWDAMATRPFAVLHSDLHRKNMITAKGMTWFVDWELALWGDPVYELAVHFHKMDYPPDQRETVLRLWCDELPEESTRAGLADLDVYLTHERIKSAIVDTIRYSKQLSSSTEPRREFLVRRLAKKLNAARPVWGLPRDLTPQQVAAVLTSRMNA